MLSADSGDRPPLSGKPRPPSRRLRRRTAKTAAAGEAPQATAALPPSPTAAGSGAGSQRENPADACHRLPRVSKLTRRVLAVNLIAPLMLLAGLLYLDQYERGLISSELDALRVQADLIAAAVGEGAVSAEVAVIEGLRVPITAHRLNPDLARAMVRRLAELGGVRARLFDPNGLLVADSRRLLGPVGAVQVYDLPPIEGPGLERFLRQLYDWSRRLFFPGPPLPRYLERREQTASDYDEVVDAIELGHWAVAMRRLDGERRVLSAAVPVQHYKQLVGAVMVSKSDAHLQRNLFEVRAAILRLFLGTLAVTVLLSLYLAGTLAQPIRRLALAAEQVRHGHGRAQAIPDLSGRDDEIGELSVSLRAMTDALWQRLDAIERFAADVAHEIKNPLTSLRSAVETLGRLKDKPAQQERLLAVIQDDVARLDRLISDISDASRLDAELSRAETGLVPLVPMLETLADVYGPAGEARGVRFVLDLPPGMAGSGLRVRGLEDRLVQVVRNLIGNALSFSPPGGTITLRASLDGRQVVLVVEDEGPGLPPGKEQAIFDRFYTERPQGEKFGTHSGLGLAISKQIVDSHQGSIVAETRRNADGTPAGARFTVRLPVA